MKTRCKFTCIEVTKRTDWRNKERFLYAAKFNVIMDGSPENKAFFDATPSGDLVIATYKEDRFTPGKDYYVDIEEA